MIGSFPSARRGLARRLLIGFRRRPTGTFGRRVWWADLASLSRAAAGVVQPAVTRPPRGPAQLAQERGNGAG
jgi:hypothetical protein